MAKKSMNEKLRNLKEDKGSGDSAEQKIKVVEGAENPGTRAKIDEELNYDEDDEAARPKPVEAAKELAEGKKEKYTRLLSEFDNMRERNKKESLEMSDKGAMEALEKILPVIDNFERALESINDEEKTPFEDGIEKIYKQLMEVLESVGVKPMNAVDTEFDPMLHNAVMHEEDPDKGENLVVEEMQKGYMYKENVLRHAMVKVVN